DSERVSLQLERECKWFAFCAVLRVLQKFPNPTPAGDRPPRSAPIFDLVKDVPRGCGSGFGTGDVIKLVSKAHKFDSLLRSARSRRPFRPSILWRSGSSAR